MVCLFAQLRTLSIQAPTGTEARTWYRLLAQACCKSHSTCKPRQQGALLLFWSELGRRKGRKRGGQWGKGHGKTGRNRP